MYRQIYRRSKILMAAIIAVILTAGSSHMTSSAAKLTRQYVIDPNGTGDFLTIQEGSTMRPMGTHCSSIPELTQSQSVS